MKWIGGLVGISPGNYAGLHKPILGPQVREPGGQVSCRRSEVPMRLVVQDYSSNITHIR